MAIGSSNLSLKTTLKAEYDVDTSGSTSLSELYRNGTTVPSYIGTTAINSSVPESGEISFSDFIGGSVAGSLSLSSTITSGAPMYWAANGTKGNNWPWNYGIWPGNAYNTYRVDFRGTVGGTNPSQNMVAGRDYAFIGNTGAAQTGSRTMWYGTGVSSRGGNGGQGPQGGVGASTQGPQGSTGASTQGPGGSTGDSNQGPGGSTGDKGPKGIKGYTAPDGPKGNRGASGADGPKGNRGATGADGAKGYIGIKGYRGAKGVTGNSPQGPRGGQGASPQGPGGDKGPKVQGYRGNQGDRGPNGSTGPVGANNTGPGGSTGDPGTKGVKGYKGGGIPFYILLDPDGNIARYNDITPSFNLTEVLDSLLITYKTKIASLE